MSLSSARNYALRAAKSQDQKEAAELLSKAILELALAIEATDAKVKKINKSSEETEPRGCYRGICLVGCVELFAKPINPT